MTNIKPFSYINIVVWEVCGVNGFETHSLIIQCLPDISELEPDIGGLKANCPPYQR
ncbi:MAG: hypothetical protein UX29_C0017G0003 [Parcubacteria group bacterium GW2011_GWA2_46_10]|nr:MAG: hypothetical protein UX29_C0017G0003 [Parcubacteria group bacterium GW2011_GWA2_46_10]